MDSSVEPAERSEDARYLFWSRYTAVQARNSEFETKAVSRRVVSCFRDLCDIVQPTLVLELGAHEAGFSRWAKGKFPDARCLAFEANPHVYEMYRDRVEKDGVDYQHLAVAAENGTVTLNIPTEHRGKQRTLTNRMGSLAVHSRSSGSETVDVKSVRVDDFVSVGPDDRIVAWIDVEGASDQVLAGASKVLAATSAVFIEVERKAMWEGQWLDLDVARYFEGLGKVPVIRDIERPHQYNVVFLDEQTAADELASRRVARVLLPKRAEPAKQRRRLIPRGR
ncbi:MAG TPA: FkbM family methyltransferase [Nocardioidaceae bacterium]|nr:FkbM family methyltransferase [Nocardioidaceae bacterium]